MFSCGYFRQIERLLSGLTLCVILLSVCACAFRIRDVGGAEFIHIMAHPDGDASPHEESSPFSVALQSLREACAAFPETPKILTLAPGHYRLAETLIFDQAFSGTEQGPVHIRGPAIGEAVFTAVMPVDGWQPYDDDRWFLSLPPDVPVPSQFFVGDVMRPMAREPDEGYYYATAPWDVADRFSRNLPSRYRFHAVPDQVPMGDAPELVVLHAWTVSRHRIAAVDPLDDPRAGVVELVPGTRHPMAKWDFHMPFWLEGHVRAVTQPGEWAVDPTQRLLVYYPLSSEDISTLPAGIPVVDRLIDVRGDADGRNPVRHIHLERLHFSGVNWSLPEGNAADGQNHRDFESAGLYMADADDVSIRDCYFSGMNVYAVWVDDGCRHIDILDNEFRDNAGGAVRVGGETLPEDSERICNNIRIKNNLIEGNGLVFRGASGIWLTYAHHSEVARNEIAYQPYTGISVGWGWNVAGDQGSYANVIHHNYIHHIGDGLLNDLAGVYLLTESPGTEVYGNVIHDVKARHYMGTGLYADSNSADIVFRDNLIFNTTTMGIFRNHGARIDIQNNIIADAGEREGLVSMSRRLTAPRDTLWLSAENNVFYSSMDTQMIAPGRFDQGPFYFANNVYWSTRGSPEFNYQRDAARVTAAWETGLSLEEWQAEGFDAGSVVADPYGLAGPGPDFRLPDDSPARAMGAGTDEFLDAGRPGHPFSTSRRDEPYVPGWPIPRLSAVHLHEGADRVSGQALPHGFWLQGAQRAHFDFAEDPETGKEVLRWNVPDETARHRMRCESGIPLSSLKWQTGFRVEGKGTFTLLIEDGRHGQITVLFDVSVHADGSYRVNGDRVGQIDRQKWHLVDIHPSTGVEEGWLVRLSEQEGETLMETIVPFYVSPDRIAQLSIESREVVGGPVSIWLDPLNIIALE